MHAAWSAAGRAGWHGKSGDGLSASGGASGGTAAAIMAAEGDGMAVTSKQEIYKHKAPWPVFASNWSQKGTDRDKGFRLALGSFREEYNNKIELVRLDVNKQANADASDPFETLAVMEHPYPATKIVWMPDLENNYAPDLLATTGDYLRIWKVQEEDHSTQVRQECLLNNNKSSEFCAPLTSFDWCETNPRLIGTSSIDTTCTIWNIEVGKEVASTTAIQGEVKTQLIAHDQEVYDIAFKPKDENTFASVGADGSVRMFDLRSLKHSKIIYEEEPSTPLLRLAWNKMDENYLATMKMNNSEVIILDIRSPCQPFASLGTQGHSKCVNGIAWSPNSGCVLSTCSDDKKALIWDIGSSGSRQDETPFEPCLAYDAGGEINQIHWSSVSPDWISICYGDMLEVLRV